MLHCWFNQTLIDYNLTLVAHTFQLSSVFGPLAPLFSSLVVLHRFLHQGDQLPPARLSHAAHWFPQTFSWPITDCTETWLKHVVSTLGALVLLQQNDTSNHMLAALLYHTDFIHQFQIALLLGINIYPGVFVSAMWSRYAVNGVPTPVWNGADPLTLLLYMLN